VTPYAGIREDIKLIRELDGKRFVYHIDLTTASWMSNPDYQIRQNDIIIVTPNKLKVNSAGLIKDPLQTGCCLNKLFFIIKQKSNMDFKRIFQILPILALVRPQSIFIFGSSCYLFKKVVAVYLTSALINVNKRKGKNTQAIAMRSTHINRLTRTYVFRNNANYFE
jgi:hypothetical protein